MTVQQTPSEERRAPGLDDLVQQGALDSFSAQAITASVRDRRSIVVIGAPRAGAALLARAIAATVEGADGRVYPVDCGPDECESDPAQVRAAIAALQFGPGDYLAPDQGICDAAPQPLFESGHPVVAFCESQSGSEPAERLLRHLGLLLADSALMETVDPVLVGMTDLPDASVHQVVGS